MTGSEETVFQSEWFTIIKQQFCDGNDQTEKPFYVMKVPESSGVLAMTVDDEIVLVKQFRPAINGYTLELTPGGIEPSNPPNKRRLGNCTKRLGTAVTS